MARGATKARGEVDPVPEKKITPKAATGSKASSASKTAATRVTKRQTNRKTTRKTTKKI
jgi:hypothetical protein